MEGVRFEERLKPIVLAELCQLLKVVAREREEVEQAVKLQLIAEQRETHGEWA